MKGDIQTWIIDLNEKKGGGQKRRLAPIIEQLPARFKRLGEVGKVVLIDPEEYRNLFRDEFHVSQEPQNGSSDPVALKCFRQLGSSESRVVFVVYPNMKPVDIITGVYNECEPFVREYPEMDFFLLSLDLDMRLDLHKIVMKDNKLSLAQL